MEIKTDKSGYSSSVKSPLNWQGNKRSLLAFTNFTKYFPPISRGGTYIELFCGSCVVFFNYAFKRNIITNVILNDQNCNIQKFFTLMRENREEMEMRLESLWIGLEDFITPKDEIDEILIWYIKNSKAPNGIQRPSTITKDFKFWCDLLNKQNVIFTSHNWKKSFKSLPVRMNKNRTNIMYFDPPYDDTKGYKCEFDLCEWAQCMSEKFITNKDKYTYCFISLNDTQKVRELFQNWHIKELYTFASTNTNKKRTELLISNLPFVNYTQKSKKLTDLGEKNE